MGSWRLRGVDHVTLVNGYYRGVVSVRAATLNPPTEPFVRASEGPVGGGLDDRRARKKRKRHEQQQRQLQQLVATGKFVPLDASVVDLLSQAHRSALLTDEWKHAVADEERAVDLVDQLGRAENVDEGCHANERDQVSVVMCSDQLYVMPPHSQFLVGDVRQTLAANATRMGRFSFILMDPPWENKSVDRKRCYGTFHHEELAKLPIHQLAAGGTDGACVLAIWVTNRPKYMAYILEELLPLWGFSYHATWYWLKVCTNGELVTPLTSPHRLPVEKLVVALRAGSPEQLNRVQSQLGSTPQVVVSVPLRHSWKPPPESFFDRETLSGANLELFARELRPHFVSAGNEPLKFQSRDHFNVAGLQCTLADVPSDPAARSSVTETVTPSNP